MFGLHYMYWLTIKTVSMFLHKPDILKVHIAGTEICTPVHLLQINCQSKKHPLTKSACFLKTQIHHFLDKTCQLNEKTMESL